MRAGWVYALLPLASMAAAQEVPLRIQAALVDADLDAKPVPRFVLEIRPVGSDRPATPVRTGLDGRVEVSLAPGRYRVVSPEPAAFRGKQYRWDLELTLEKPTTLELSNDNAIVTEPAARVMDELAPLAERLARSVVTVWSEQGQGAGVIVDGAGLILTNSHVAGSSGYLAVQFDADRKIPARRLASDAREDLAVLWADLAGFPDALPAVLASGGANSPSVIVGERVLTIGSPLGLLKLPSTGTVSKVGNDVIFLDIELGPGNSGGPLFNSRGEVVGIATFIGLVVRQGGILPIGRALPLLQQAREATLGQKPPAPEQLEVIPREPFPLEPIESALRAASYDLSGYEFKAGDYDVMLSTPVSKFRRTFDEMPLEWRMKAAQADDMLSLRKWAQELGELAPVVEVFVRRTRGRSEFEGLRLSCGDTVARPIHPGKVTGFGDPIGVYTYRPEAFAPECSRITLEILSKGDPAKPTLKVLDAGLSRMIAADFSAWRANRRAPATPATKPDAVAGLFRDALLPEVLGRAFEAIRSGYVEPVRSGELVRAAVRGMLSPTGPGAGIAMPPDIEKTVERAARESDVGRQIDALTQILWRITSRHGDGVDARTVTHGAIRAMLEAVDRNGTFIPRGSAREPSDNPEAAGRIGVSLMKQPDLVVSSAEPGSPAERAGLDAEDHLLEIDGQPTAEMTLDDVMRRLGGPAGSEVRLRIRRHGAQPFEVTLAREVVQAATVLSRNLDGGIRYARLTSFPDSAAKELQEALRDGSGGEVTAAILDLRNNSGGILREAERVAGLFLEKGQPIFSSVGRKRRTRWVAEADGPLRSLPLVVLVNKASAGAAEIVAGALQDRKRAALVGTPTSGSGSIRTLINLADRSVLWLTTERLLSAKDRPIEGQGLTPDVVVDARAEGVAPGVVRFGDLASDRQLQRAVEILRSRQPNRR